MTVEHRAAPGLNDVEIELADDGQGPALRLRRPVPDKAVPEPQTAEQRIVEVLADAEKPLSQAQIRKRAATRNATVSATHRATDRLHHAAPSAKALFAAAAERNHHLGVLARGLIELLNAYGPLALERAFAAALDSDAAYLGGVRHFIDQHRKQSDKPPPLALDLPDDPRLRTLSVRPHDLADYDRLHDESDSGDNDVHRDHDHEPHTHD